MGWQPLEHGAGQCGFTRTHFAGEQYKATFAIKAVFEMGYGLTMMVTGIQKPRVWNYRERLFGKAKMLEINTHSARLLLVLLLYKIFQLLCECAFVFTG